MLLYQWLVIMAILWLHGILVPRASKLLPEALNLLPGDWSLLREALKRSQGFEMDVFALSFALKTTHGCLLRPTVMHMYLGAVMDVLETVSSSWQPKPP